VRWHAQGQTYARAIHDDQGDPAFGPLTLAPAFRVSSNIYFATLAAELGAEALHGMLADRLGFRHVPALPSFGPDLADIGYGQGRMLASPLEMARLAASVANEGKMMEARIVTSLTDPAGIDKKKIYSPLVRSQAMTPGTAATLRDLMRSVVTDGTARGVFDGLPVTVAGKTGTAQNHQQDHQPHSWFIGFAPAADHTEPNTAPRYAFACVVENGGYGRAVAAAACRNLLRKLY
jgi:cell division protein FtsI/penicillin-binding protein 2